jgi:hypothetical protein
MINIVSQDIIKETNEIFKDCFSLFSDQGFKGLFT